MKIYCLIYFVLISVSLAFCRELLGVDVQIPAGTIRGTVQFPRGGTPFSSFLGIRYAKSPEGPLRFQPPQPPERWTGAFDARLEGPACPQSDRYLYMSEDCLRLNVYSPKILGDEREDDVKLPVMFFLHPGAFAYFSGRRRIFGPEPLMKKKIVLVTINYRLSTLGFISTGDSLAPGNLGLKDQVAALRWVQAYIGAFGGDPNSVTIVGGSAGARSVLLHMVSPMSKGLFHGAISMGGSPLAPGGLPTEQKYIVKKQAELLGCPTGTMADMIKCLKTKPALEFGISVPEFAEWQDKPLMIWSPVVEPEVRGVERFLPDQPENLIRAGKVNAVPFICGVTENEFDGFIIPFVKQLKAGNTSAMDDLYNNWYKLAPINFVYERNTYQSRHISQRLRQFYFNDEPIRLNNIENLGHLYSDSMVIHRARRAVQLLSEHTDQPVYLYKFTHKGKRDLYMWNATTPYGVSHQSELLYLFKLGVLIAGMGVDSREMVELMTSLWSNFVSSGNPISSESPITGFTWDRYNSSKDNYLDINLEPSMKTGLFRDRMQIWDELFPL